jgi:predicted outer membrane protein
MRTYLFCIAILAGCGDSDNNDNRDAALDEGDLHGQQLSAAARADLVGTTDDEAIALAADIVSTVNTGELAQADFMLSASTNAAVLELAAQIQADHQANNLMLQSLLIDVGLVKTSNDVSASLSAEAMTGLAQLQADAPANLDYDYVRMQVSMHQEVSVLLDALRDDVSDSNMNDFLSDTQDKVNEHRDHAGDVLNDL